MTAGIKENKKLKEMDKRREEKETKAALPPIIAFTMEHDTGPIWKLRKLSIKDNKVVSEEVKECFDKQHAVESFQIEFVKTFIYGQ